MAEKGREEAIEASKQALKAALDAAIESSGGTDCHHQLSPGAPSETLQLVVSLPGVADSAVAIAGGTAAEMAELKLKLEAANKINEQQKEDEEGLLLELDEIGKSFEEMQEQNAKLLVQLKDKDDENFRLMSSRVKDNTKQAVMEDAARAREMRVRALETRVAAQAEALQKTEAAEGLAQEQLQKLNTELSASQLLGEQCRTASHQANEKLVALKSIFDIADKQRVELEKTATGAVAEKNVVVSQNSRLETECSSLKRKWVQ